MLWLQYLYIYKCLLNVKQWRWPYKMQHIESYPQSASLQIMLIAHKINSYKLLDNFIILKYLWSHQTEGIYAILIISCNTIRHYSKLCLSQCILKCIFVFCLENFIKTKAIGNKLHIILLQDRNMRIKQNYFISKKYEINK